MRQRWVERSRAAVEETPFHIKEGKILCRVTISVSVSGIIDCDDFGLGELVRRTDDALYDRSGTVKSRQLFCVVKLKARGQGSLPKGRVKKRSVVAAEN
jgi:hypothetical protein